MLFIIITGGEEMKERRKELKHKKKNHSRLRSTVFSFAAAAAVVGVRMYNMMYDLGARSTTAVGCEKIKTRNIPDT